MAKKKPDPMAAQLAKTMNRTIPKAQMDTYPSEPVKPSTTTAGGKCHRTGVSLYDDDLRRINDIKAFVMHQGVNGVNQAEVIRAALRAAPLNQSLVDGLLANRGNDGRAKH